MDFDDYYVYYTKTSYDSSLGLRSSPPLNNYVGVQGNVFTNAGDLGNPYAKLGAQFPLVYIFQQHQLWIAKVLFLIGHLQISLLWRKKKKEQEENLILKYYHWYFILGKGQAAISISL